MNLKIDLVIGLDVPNDKLVKRLLERGKTSGRNDDQSEDKINKRLEEYDKKTKPLIIFYENQNKFYSIDGVGSLNDVNNRLINVVDSIKNDWR